MDRILVFLLMAIFAASVANMFKPAIDATDDLIFMSSDEYNKSTTLTRVYDNMSKGINELRGDQVRALFKNYEGSSTTLKVSGVTKTYSTLIPADIDVTRIYTVTVTRDGTGAITVLNFVVKP